MSILQAAPFWLGIVLKMETRSIQIPILPREGVFSFGLRSLQIYFPIRKSRIVFKSTFINKIYRVCALRFNPKDFHIDSRELEPAVTKYHDHRYINLKLRITTGRKPKEIMLIDHG